MEEEVLELVFGKAVKATNDSRTLPQEMGFQDLWTWPIIRGSSIRLLFAVADVPASMPLHACKLIDAAVGKECSKRCCLMLRDLNSISFR